MTSGIIWIFPGFLTQVKKILKGWRGIRKSMKVYGRCRRRLYFRIPLTNEKDLERMIGTRKNIKDLRRETRKNEGGKRDT